MPPVHVVVGRRVAIGTAGHADFTYSVVEPDIGLADRRRERRLRTRLREALVAERRGRTLTDCRIKDLTRSGARIQLDSARPLPRSFFLTEAGSRHSYRATLIWQSGRDAGVRLVPSD